MKSLGIEEVVVALPRTVIELKRLRGANAPRESSIRGDVYAAGRFAGNKTERNIGGEFVDGRSTRGRLYVVDVQAEACRIQQLRSKSMILFNRHDIPARGIVIELVV